MELHELLDKVEDPASFLEFARLLREDRLAEVGRQTDAWGRGVNGWENHTVVDFLEAAFAWGKSTDLGASQGLENASAWKRCATFLYCGKIYE